MYCMCNQHEIKIVYLNIDDEYSKPIVGVTYSLGFLVKNLSLNSAFLTVFEEIKKVYHIDGVN